tara:strand:- start:3264 stop:5831 length:2568 start_codon:yes stop_codon:yes gene_type:complete
LVKIVPQGGVANMGVTDPMENLNKVIDTFSKLQTIVGNQRLLAEQKDNTTINTLSTITDLINKADDPGDLNFAKNMFANINSNDISNTNVEAIYGSVGTELNSKSDTFDNLMVQGNEIANLITSNFSVFDKDSDGPMTDKPLSQMNANELINYFGSVKGEKFNSAFGGITKLNEKINLFRLQLGKAFGVTEDGNFIKSPNFKFTDANGTVMDPNEFLLQLDKYQSRVNIFIESAFRDNTLNEEEAMAIVSGDYKAYENLRTRRDAEYKFLAEQGISSLKSINSKIVQLSKSTDNESISQNIYAILDSDPTLVDDIKALTDGGDTFNITSDVEQNKKNATIWMTSRYTLDQNLDFFNKYHDETLAEHNRYAEKAKSWGFLWFGEDPSESVETNMFYNNDGGPGPGDGGPPPGGGGPGPGPGPGGGGAGPDGGAKELIDTSVSDENIDKPGSASGGFLTKYGPGAAAIGAYYYADEIGNFGKNLKAAHKLPTSVISDYLSGDSNNPLGNIKMSSKDIEIIDKKIKSIDTKIKSTSSRVNYYNEKLIKYDLEADKISTSDALDKNLTQQQRDLKERKRKIERKKIVDNLERSKKDVDKLNAKKSKLVSSKTDKNKVIKSYSVSKKVNHKNVKRLIDGGAETRFNVFNLKKSINEGMTKGWEKTKTFTKGATKAAGTVYLPFQAGTWLGDKLGYDTEGWGGYLTSGAAGIGGSYVLKKIYEKKIQDNINYRVVSAMMNQQKDKIVKKTGDYLIKKGFKKIGEAIIKRGGSALIGGSATGGVTPASLVWYLANAGLLAKDIYDIGAMLLSDNEIGMTEKELEEYNRSVAELFGTSEGRQTILAEPTDRPVDIKNINPNRL